jgi:hypothetical protein
MAGKVPAQPFLCYAVPTGCLLIDLSIMAQISQPWFQVTHKPDGSVDMGEDVWFCVQVRAAGFEVWCDPTIPVGHIGDYRF